MRVHPARGLPSPKPPLFGPSRGATARPSPPLFRSRKRDPVWTRTASNSLELTRTDSDRLGVLFGLTRMPARPPERRADLSSPAGPRRREPDDRLDRPGPAGGLSVYWRRCRRRRRRQAITWLQIIRPGSAVAVEQVPLPPPPPLASARVPLRGEREGGRLTGGGGYGGGRVTRMRPRAPGRTGVRFRVDGEERLSNL